MTSRANGMMTPVTRNGLESDNVVLPHRRTGIREYVCDGETVLFDPVTWRTCVLNATAYDIWQRCDGRSTMRQIAKRQAREYEVGFDTALDHVEQVAALFASLILFDADEGDATIVR
jgi:hypothetical protein